MKYVPWVIPLILSSCAAATAQDQAVPWITSTQRLTILSANDGQTHLRSDPNVKTVTQDSITVIHLGPDHPPIVKTVYATVPNTISGAPYMAMTGDGRYGFVTSLKIPQDPEVPEVISVIDLASPELKVVQTVELPRPRMAVMHPDGRRLLVPYDTGIRVFEMRDGRLELVKDNPTEFRLHGIAISPNGDRVAGNGTKPGGKLAVHVLSYRDGDIAYQSEVQIKPGVSDWDGPFACRFTIDSRRLIIPNGGHAGSKGTLAPVFIADLSLDPPAVTEVIPQVADGIEGVAVHPSGKFAVLSCLEDSPRLVHQAYSHLAVIDLSTKPARLLYHLDVESLPEGMEFSPDGSQLFVGLTYAHRIAVYDVDGFRLKRSPCVLRVGHGPCSMAIGPRFVVARQPITLNDVDEGLPEITADEPLAAEFSAKKAAEYLDRSALNWQKTKKCATCHTNLFYMVARPALSKILPDSGEVRGFYEDYRKVRWAKQGPKESQGFWPIVVGTGLTLNDAQTTGELSEVAREVLDLMWAVQREDGGWEWPDCDYAPMEIDDHYGVTVAALAVGIAPGGYAETPQARAGLAKLRGYFKNNPPKSLHHRAMLAWCSVRIDGIATEEERKKTLAELLALQLDDGGWSTAGFLTDWKGLARGDGQPLDVKTSDGYGTGLVILIARELGVPADDARLRRGIEWLHTHQRESGKWFTRSPVNEARNLISNVGSAYAILALQACDELPGRVFGKEKSH